LLLKQYNDIPLLRLHFTGANTFRHFGTFVLPVYKIDTYYHAYCL